MMENSSIFLTNVKTIYRTVQSRKEKYEIFNRVAWTEICKDWEISNKQVFTRLNKGIVSGRKKVSYSVTIGMNCLHFLLWFQRRRYAEMGVVPGSRVYSSTLKGSISTLSTLYLSFLGIQQNIWSGLYDV